MKMLILSVAFAMTATTAFAQVYTGPRATTPTYTMGRYQAANEGGQFLEPANPLQQRQAGVLATEAGVACDLVSAGIVKESNKGGKHTISYEVACKDDFGWVISKVGDKVSAYDCVALAASEKMAKGKLATCRLQANMGSQAGVANLAKKAGLTCAPAKSTYLGGGGEPAISRYEVLCDSGAGYIIDAPQPRSKAALQAMSCARAKTSGAGVCGLKPGKG